jgi:hypothetical protein
MRFASEKQEAEFYNPKCNPMVLRILTALEEVSKKAYGTDLAVTSIFRTKEQDKALGGSGIHCMWRAIDIAAPSWDDPASKALADTANSIWDYDPLRPHLLVALYAPHASATGSHIHLQVCDRTKGK